MVGRWGLFLAALGRGSSRAPVSSHPHGQDRQNSHKEPGKCTSLGLVWGFSKTPSQERDWEWQSGVEMEGSANPRSSRYQKITFFKKKKETSSSFSWLKNLFQGSNIWLLLQPFIGNSVLDTSSSVFLRGRDEQLQFLGIALLPSFLAGRGSSGAI